MLKKFKALNPRSAQFQSRRDIQHFSQNLKVMYHPLQIGELRLSRLMTLNVFTGLFNQLEDWNKELAQWKANKHGIPNFTLTYHFYENLFSRLRYISYFVENSQKAHKELQQLSAWFYAQKPRIRNQQKQIKPQLKSETINTAIKRSPSLPANILIQELQPYKKKQRTFHNALLPPKERLKDYKRKQFISLDIKEDKQFDKSSEQSSVYQMKLNKYKNSLMSATRSTFKETRDSFKKTITDFKIEEEKKQPQKIKEEEKPEEELEEPKQQQKQEEKEPEKEKEKQPEKEQEKMEEEQEEEEEQEDKDKIKIKVFTSDHDIYDRMISKKMSQLSMEASLKQFNKISQNKVRYKMDDVNVKDKMNQWAKMHGHGTHKENQKLQRLHKCNKYAKTEHKAPQKVKKQTKEVPLLYRHKSSHQVSIQKSVENANFRKTMKNWGKYIDHGIKYEKVSEEQEQQLRTYRSASLTAHADQGKRRGVQSIVQRNLPETYNEDVQEEIVSIKLSLAGKRVSVDNKSIFKGMSIPEAVPLKKTYSENRKLLSNPYFAKDEKRRN